MKSVKPKQTKSVALRLALLAFSVYMIVSLFDLQIQLTEKRNELSNKTAEYERIEQNIVELTDLLKNGTQSDFIERAARDRLGYVYADEQIFTDISGK